jgi:hypothetical protein
MAKQYYDRYKDFRINNEIKTLPFIKIKKRDTDIIIEYKKNKTRLDIVSNTYYGTPYYGWLILLANPRYGLEFDIPDGSRIRVPFPLINVLQDYNEFVKNYDVLYKINS